MTVSNFQFRLCPYITNPHNDTISAEKRVSLWEFFFTVSDSDGGTPNYNPRGRWSPKDACHHHGSFNYS